MPEEIIHNNGENNALTHSEVRECIPVSRLYFFVHPGYASDRFPLEGNPRRRATQFPIHPRSTEKFLEYDQMLGEIGKNDLAVIFLHHSLWILINEDYEKEYVSWARRAKEKLGRRCIVFSSGPKGNKEFNPAAFTNGPQIAQVLIDKIRHIATLRGYEISNKTKPVGLGELIHACVPAANANLNFAGGFAHPTRIPYTPLDLDLANLSPEDWKSVLRRSVTQPGMPLLINFEEEGPFVGTP